MPASFWRNAVSPIVAWLCLVPLWVCTALAQTVQPAGTNAKPPAYVEDSPAAQDLLEQARQTLSLNRPADAVTMYQQLLEGFPGKLIDAGDRTYMDVAKFTAKEIRTNEALLAAYRQATNALAQRALASARGEEDLDAVVTRYGLTPAGLDAALKIAALRIERADMLDALSVLDPLADHPDIDTQAKRWHILSSAACLLGGARERARPHIAALDLKNDAQTLTTLQSWARVEADPSLLSAWSTGRRPIDVKLPDKLAQQLWKLEIADVPASETQRRALQQMKTANQQVQPFLTLVPAPDGDRVLINNGALVFAVDRFSGRVAWANQAMETDLDAGMRPWVRMTARVPDARGVGLGGDIAAAVVGFASPGFGAWQAQAASTNLVAMRRTDGKMLWRVEPKSIDAGLANAFFHGTPIVAQGRVVVLMRRSQMSGFQDAYIAAVDAATGKPLWRRYLSSAVNMNQMYGRLLAQMTLEGPTVYVADQLGSVASIDTRSGAVNWLRLIGEPGQPIGVVTPGRRGGDQVRPPIPTPPVLCDSGLIVPAVVVNKGYVLLDPNNGKKLRDLDDVTWTSAACVLPFGGDVIQIGSSVSRLDGKSVELKPKWEREISAGPDASPRGITAITSDTISIPYQDRVISLNAATGELRFDVQAETPGNLLAMDGQMLMIDADSVRSYMDPERVRVALLQQASQEPANPNPMLTLAQLVLWLDKRTEAINATDAALASIELAGKAARDNEATADLAETRAESFRRILSLAEWPRDLDAATRGAFFERAHRLIGGPEQEIAYQFAIGSFLSQSGKPEEAADHYQAVLGDPVLSSRLYEQGGAARQAGLEARLRLAELIRGAGPRVYAKHDADAGRRLAELASGANPDPEALLDLSRRYPLSRHVPKMLLAAADGLASRGETSAAMLQLRRAYAQSGENAEVLPEVVGRLVDMYVKNGQPRVAMQWLERARREHQEMKPLREGKAVTPDSWLAELAKLPTGEQPLPSLRTPLSQPVVLPGRLLTPTAQSEDNWPRDRFVTLRGDKLEYRTAQDLVPKWTATVPAAGVELLWINRRSVALYDATVGALNVLDAENGKLLWPAINIRKLLDEAGADQEKQAARPVEERQFMAKLNMQGVVIRNGRVVPVRQPIPANEMTIYIRSNENCVVLADRAGRVTSIEQATGRVLWRTLCAFDRLEAIDLDSDTLAMAGTINSEIDVPNGALVLLDPSTGEPRSPMLEEKNTYQWMSLGGDGLVIGITTAEVVARHAIDGSIAWRTTSGTAGFMGVACAGSDLVVVQDKDGLLHAIDTQSGRVLQRLPLPTSDTRAISSLRSVEGQWQILSPSAAIAIGPDARRRWSDAIDADSKYLWRQLVGEKHVVLLNIVSGPAAPWPRPSSGAGFAPPATPNAAAQQPAGGNAQLNQQDLQDAMRVAALRGEARIERGGVQIVVKMDNGKALLQERQLVEVRPRDAAVPNPAGAEGSRYGLYILDRRTGAVVDQRDLGPVRDPLEPVAQFLDNAILLGTGNATIVIRGAPPK